MQYEELFININTPEPLSKEELHNCFLEMYQGNKEARDKIISHNIRLVISEVKKKFANTSYDLSELVSIGLIGLIKSVDTFDIGKEISFFTYATICIDNEILNFLQRNKKYLNNVSLYQPTLNNKQDKEISFEETLIDTSVDLIADYEKKELYKITRNIVESLSKREKAIIMGQFGFIDNQRMTQKEIAKELGLTQSYVSKISLKILNKIKEELEALKIIETSKFKRPTFKRKLTTINEEISVKNVKLVRKNPS